MSCSQATNQPYLQYDVGLYQIVVYGYVMFVPAFHHFDIRESLGLIVHHIMHVYTGVTSAGSVSQLAA